VRGELRDEDNQRAENDREWIADAGDQRHRIPYRLTEDDNRRAGHCHPDERERSHRGGQAEDLAERLRTLVSCVPCEVRDVEAQRGPVAHVRRQRGREQLPERQMRRLEPAGFAENVTETATTASCPREQQQAAGQEQGCRPAL